jgi:hypothetical protein
MSTTQSPRNRLAPLLAPLAMLTGLVVSAEAHADVKWVWQYAEVGALACGTFQTTDAPNSDGYFEIVSITGHRGDDQITSLVPAGTSIPGNEPYIVDNLIKPTRTAQLTLDGFGYSLASGTYANPYYHESASRTGYLEVYITPTSFAEVPVEFKATPLQGKGFNAALADEISRCQ